MKTDLKRANGLGSVYKLSGRRSRPYVAVITSSCTKNDNRYIQNRTPIGYFENRDDAILALTEYIHSPYDMRKRKYKLSDVYSEWSKVHFAEISPSAVRTWKSAYSYLSPLHNIQFTDIRTRDLDDCIKNAPVHSSTKKKIKSLCNLLYKYAIKCEISNTNYSEYCDKIQTDPPVYTRNPFSEEELHMLWKNVDKPYVDMIVIAIYTGWRPQELTKLQTNNISLEDMTMYGGMKTSAGINRIVPIHSEIIDLITDRYKYAKNNSLPALFDSKSNSINYTKYNRRFINIMNSFNMNHKPHDTRHTFITLAKEANMNDFIIKQIVGHTTEDITERVYTHRSIESLKDEIEKIRIYK